MARTRLSYPEAVRLLAGSTDVTVLGRLMGGALLIGRPASPRVLDLLDATGEANALLLELVGRAPSRIRASRGKRHYELLEAAHAVLIVSSFLDALVDWHAKDQFDLRLGEEEREVIAKGRSHAFRDELAQPSATMPGTLWSFADNVPAVEEALIRMARAGDTFLHGLEAGAMLPWLIGAGREKVSRNAVINNAMKRYRKGYARLAAETPEFALWTGLAEPEADPADRPTDTLARLEELLAATLDAASPAVEAEERLARHAAAVLRQPLWRAEGMDDLSFPTVEDGFVSPRFRLARADRESRLADETWWAGQPERDDLASFLAVYFADPAGTQRPLVVLGHPGAGKSLLTEVLAARLPSAAFTTVRVPLRAVDPDAQIHQQVEDTVESLVKERITWGELCRASDTTKVVLLDGFDELVQATGVAQSHYLGQAASFQQDEWVNGRPAVVVVTSRTLVMDRVVVPTGTIVVKLEPFDRPQADRWVEAWNAANAGRGDVRALTTEELWRHQELAAQPLLLLMLAIYAVQDADGLGAVHLRTADLYRRLLDLFIRRQVRDKARTDLGAATFAEREAEARRDLAAVAFAMFNRGQQYVSEDDLDRDLEALHPGLNPAEGRPGEPLTRARRTIAGFFFVHVAQTDDHARSPGRRTYEFLHATFAEYLVAEQTVELLRDLADDWRRSRRRSYGASLDERVLRALLSHQPLTNGDEILPFLVAEIGSLDPETRTDLRDALIELFRGARRNVPDDAYRPTPFDVVTRAAAYTANLTLLAALCDPGGLPVSALCDFPDAPSIESTVRLWRGGLDPESQVAFFRRLGRTDDRLLVSDFDTDMLPLVEARLTGDIRVETVVRAGRTTFREDGPVTPFQRDFHLDVMEIDSVVWRGAPGSRLPPYDENMYATLAQRAEGASELPSATTVHRLVTLLIEDAPGLSADLVDRLLTAVIIPMADDLQPHLTVLALRQPELFRRHPELRRAIRDNGLPAFLHEVAVAVRRENPAVVDPVIDELRALIAAPQSRTPNSYAVTPSMITNLTFAPHLLPRIIIELAKYPELAWPQVAPRKMLAALNAMTTPLGEVREALADYVLKRGNNELADEDRAALDEIRARLEEPSAA